eukprot:2152203-Prorocentrum_lima.AAC.1
MEKRCDAMGTQHRGDPGTSWPTSHCSTTRNSQYVHARPLRTSSLHIRQPVSYGMSHHIPRWITSFTYWLADRCTRAR